MFHRNACKNRLRPFLQCRPYACRPTNEPLIYRRLADRTHRTIYASYERETNVHRSASARLKLKPSINHFLLWLHRKRENKLELTTLNPRSLPRSYKEAAVTEIALFHVLSCLCSSSEDKKWLEIQDEQLKFLQAHLLKQKTEGIIFTKKDARDLAAKLGFTIGYTQENIIHQALKCVSAACPKVSEVGMLVPWVKSLMAPRVSEACSALSNLTYIPSCVSADILLRTPLSADEVALQLDLWDTFMYQISRDNIDKRTHVESIIRCILYYTVQFDPQKLEKFVKDSLTFLTSTRSGFQFKVMTEEHINLLIYLLALMFIKNGSSGTCSPMPIIKAQKVLAEYLGQDRLSQKGYIGITLLICHESKEKALKLLKITKSYFPHQSDLIHIAKIYLSTTPEEVFYSFNDAIAQYPKSATMWFMLAKRLQQLQVLTEARSQKLLLELLKRKKDLVISKDIILLLLGAVNSVSGIEDFLQAVKDWGVLKKFQNVILNKYMSLLYRYSKERSVHKPFLDKIIHQTSNVECARYLYQNNVWKTISSIGVMLNGEVNHKPGKIYELYCRELQGNIPDEACLIALLRASTKRVNGAPYSWGQLYAPQVAVHEFKKHVRNEATINDAYVANIYPSNKLWQVYIHALSSAEYTAELAEIIRWWESIQFTPSRTTLLLLLRCLPRDFSERHIMHAHSFPKSSVLWPWPRIQDVRE